MIVVCDSPILITLSTINQLHLLSDMFGGVFIPQGVFDEVVVRGAGRAGSEESQNADFIHTEQIQDPTALNDYAAPLSPIDAEVIVLGKEKDADLILTRDKRVRRRARQEGLRVASLMEFFIFVKQGKFITAVKPHLDELRNNGVVIREGIYQETLRRAGEL